MHNQLVKTHATVRKQRNGILVDQVKRRVYLAQRKLVVILVIQDVHQVSVKRMNVLQLGEVREQLAHAVMEVLLSELHFAHVELSDTGYLVVPVNDSGGLSLCL